MVVRRRARHDRARFVTIDGALNGSRNMMLRFAEDRRTLIWAWLLFPLGPALVLYRPALLPWAAPLLLYCSYLSGVLSHNHNHSPVFRARRLNLVYGAWLSFFYGFPSFAWIPSHNQDHHRHLNGPDDASHTARHGRRDSLLVALTYPLTCSRQQLPLVWSYAVGHVSRRSAQAPRIVLEVAALVVGHTAVLAFAIWLHGPSHGSALYALAVGLPALLGNYWMMLTNYLQHVGCNYRSEFDHSRNFVSPFWNWFVFDNGYHTVHHQHPGLHWSRYRALHRLRETQIRADLKQGFIVRYALRRYLLGASE